MESLRPYLCTKQPRRSELEAFTVYAELCFNNAGTFIRLKTKGPTIRGFLKDVGRVRAYLLSGGQPGQDWRTGRGSADPR